MSFILPVCPLKNVCQLLIDVFVNRGFMIAPGPPIPGEPPAGHVLATGTGFHWHRVAGSHLIFDFVGKTNLKKNVSQHVSGVAGDTGVAPALAGTIAGTLVEVQASSVGTGRGFEFLKATLPHHTGTSIFLHLFPHSLRLRGQHAPMSGATPPRTAWFKGPTDVVIYIYMYIYIYVYLHII